MRLQASHGDPHDGGTCLELLAHGEGAEALGVRHTRSDTDDAHGGEHAHGDLGGGAGLLEPEARLVGGPGDACARDGGDCDARDGTGGDTRGGEGGGEGIGGDLDVHGMPQIVWCAAES